MPTFTVTGEIDPFLHVNLARGETIYTESDAMVTMDTTLELTGQMRGGFFSAVARRLTNDESFFQTQIEAQRGEGDVLLSPALPGSIEILEIGQKQYLLNDGSFLAATNKVDLRVRTQGIGQALFGGTGGFFLTETTGSGQLAVSGFGAIFGLEISPATDVIVDNYHVVAWDNTLRYDLSLGTSSGGGFLSNLVSSVTTGEGIVNRFSGSGKVYVCSRNRGGFLDWIRSNVQTTNAR